MRLRNFGFTSIVSILALATPSLAAADIVNFTGTGSATAAVGPYAGCAPLPFQGVASGSGTSAFGSFAYSHTVCTAGATGAVQGIYTIDFGADQFSGTLDGTASNSSTAGLFDLLLNYQILAGTGRFSTASGGFTGVGTVDVRGGPPSRLALSFAAVPEPGSWALLLLGFAVVGWSERKRSATSRQSVNGVPSL